MRYYILDGHKIVAVGVDAFIPWYESAELRRVDRADVGDAEVSTVFLGIDHSFGGDRVPLLFETMIFGGPFDEYTERHTSWQDAQRRHDEIVAQLRAGTFSRDAAETVD